MTSIICSVHGCYNNWKKKNWSLQQECFAHGKRRGECCGPAFNLYPPPHGEQDRRLWLRALNLKKPPKKPYVCSFHFVDGKPTIQHPYPEKWLGYEAPERRPRRQLVRRSGKFTLSLLCPDVSLLKSMLATFAASN